MVSLRQEFIVGGLIEIQKIIQTQTKAKQGNQILYKEQ